jgi:predicted ATPase with chaperone activity
MAGFSKVMWNDRFEMRVKTHSMLSVDLENVADPSRECCKPDPAGEELLKMAITKLGFSGRVYDRILRVGTTIADMAGSAAIRPEHISDAIQYRSLDRNPSRYP